MAVREILSSTQGLFSSVRGGWNEASLVARTAAVATPIFIAVGVTYTLRHRSQPQVELEADKPEEGIVWFDCTAGSTLLHVTELIWVDRTAGSTLLDVSEFTDVSEDNVLQNDEKKLVPTSDDYVFDPPQDLKRYLLRFMIPVHRYKMGKVSQSWKRACTEFHKGLYLNRKKRFGEVLSRGVGGDALFELIRRGNAVDEHMVRLKSLVSALMSHLCGYWGNDPGRFNTAIDRVRNAAEPILSYLRKNCDSLEEQVSTRTTLRPHFGNRNEATASLELVAELFGLLEGGKANEPRLLTMTRTWHGDLVKVRVDSLMGKVERTFTYLRAKAGKWEKNYPAFKPLTELICSCQEIAKAQKVESVETLLSQVNELNSIDTKVVCDAIKALEDLPEKPVELAKQLACVAKALGSYTSALEQKVVPVEGRSAVEEGGFQETILGALKTLLNGVLSLRNKKTTFYALIPAARAIIQPLVFRFVIGPAIDRQIEEWAEDLQEFDAPPLDAVKETADELYSLAKDFLTIVLNTIYDHSDHPIFDLGWNNLSELVEAAACEDEAFFAEKVVEAVELLHKGGKNQGLAHVVDALKTVSEQIIAGEAPGYSELCKAELYWEIKRNYLRAAYQERFKKLHIERAEVMGQLCIEHSWQRVFEASKEVGGPRQLQAASVNFLEWDPRFEEAREELLARASQTRKRLLERREQLEALKREQLGFRLKQDRQMMAPITELTKRYQAKVKELEAERAKALGEPSREFQLAFLPWVFEELTRLLNESQ